MYQIHISSFDFFLTGYLFRYPLNFYKTFRVTIVTALLKKRLKFLILLSLILIQVKNTIPNS